MRALVVLLTAFFIVLPAFSGPLTVSQGQRELGRVLVSELSLREGKLIFRTASGGCTDAGSFTVDSRKEDGISPGVPHYVLTIRRIRIDDCKALLRDGVLIELDLERDLGLKGNYTVSVENPVSPESGGPQ